MTVASRSEPNHVAVIDIGKSNAKLALVDLPTLSEIDVMTRPNDVREGPPWPHYDVKGHWDFLLQGLAQFHKDHRIDAIAVTTHGASAALLARDGTLAAPILDYEHEYDQRYIDDYATLKPDFRTTGSPTLVGGLNVGAQLHWQFAIDPTLRDRTAQIVTYPQYWGHLLTGVAATDVTSIGCHTDLWNPREGGFSDLPAKLGIEGKIAPVRKSNEVLGTVLPEVAKRTGLPPDTPVCVGIHDSNASLYPHLLSQTGPFSVVSTGTWVVVMTIGGSEVTMDASGDMLVIVNAFGQAVPSPRFMGGREHALLQQGQAVDASEPDVADVLSAQLMVLPAVDPRTGPFAGQEMRWNKDEPALGTGTRSAAVSFYLAMMTDTCLRLAGATGPTIIEGPFANNCEFTTLLAVATGRPVLTSAAATGTSIGAALLFQNKASSIKPTELELPDDVSDYQNYAALWHSIARQY
ncbi:MAG: FGGY-family carbohydrate kinase [Aliishimia sp.]